MAFEQRQIVEVQFRLPPDGELKNHPAVIISNSEINSEEFGFTAVMITHSDSDDEYTFEIDDKMFLKSFQDKSHKEIRLHLISYFLDDDVISNNHGLNKMKPEWFKRLLSQINEITFGIKVSVE